MRLPSLASSRVLMASQKRLGMVQRHVSSSAESSSLVIKQSLDGLRILTLNRPAKLNSLNVEMVTDISTAFRSWGKSELAYCILLKGNGRAFCAGGDVNQVVKDAKDPSTRAKAVEFFKDEYECDSYIAHLKKPVVTFMDGFTMGGGVGLSVHAAFRVATENTKFSMPETKIGLYPDVGVAFKLARLDGYVGLYLGLTSDIISGYEAYLLGLATHYIPSDRLSAVQDRLAELSATPSLGTTDPMELVNTALEEFAADQGQLSKLENRFEGVYRQAIDHVFSQASVLDMVKELKKLEQGQVEQFANQNLEDWAKKTREAIEFRSPTSCVVAHLAFKKAKDMSLNQVFEMDMRLSATCCDLDVTTDFVNGVETVLSSDKERKKQRPDWNPNSIDAVSPATVEATFFGSQSATKLPIPKLSLSEKSYKTYPHDKFALPSEAAIASIVQGTSPASGNFALRSADELRKIVHKQWPNKIGLDTKLNDVIQRKTFVKSDELKWQY